jgi:NAD+ diphosphatase
MAGRGLRIGFTGASLDRADHLRLDEERVREMRERPDARLLRLAMLEPEVDAQGSLGWGPAADHGGEDLIFLGLSQERPLFAPLPRLAAAQHDPRALFGLIERLRAEDAAIWGTAISLVQWHNRHLFCGVCGSATVPFRAGWGRRCGRCGTEHFPRVDPVVIMLAEHEGRVLLARQHRYPPRRYSALAGFVEPGESVEEAVTREIAEEAGIEVANVRYIASQPWPFPGSLMIGCHATATSDALTLDGAELEDAFWADEAAVAAALQGEADAPSLAPPPFAIAHSLLTHWLESRG